MATGSPFFESLRRATWRNIPFGVTSTTISLGRKLAVHEYPFVDGVYAEDLGAKGKRWHVQGFLVEGGGAYGGKGTLAEQILEFWESSNQYGNGIFVHPTVGTRPQCALDTFDIDQDINGRMATLRMSFIESKVRPTAMTVVNTQAQTTTLALQAHNYFRMSFLDMFKMVKGLVRAVRNGILNVVNRFTTVVRGVVFTATSLVTMVTSLPGEIGRFIGSAIPQRNKKSTTVESLIGLGSASRQSVLNNLDTLANAVETLNIEGIADGIQSTIAAVFNANPDPVQALASMQDLLQIPDATGDSPDATGWNIVNGLIRRTAVAYIAQSTANRQFVSYDDAQATRTIACNFLDDEIVRAGDDGLDDSYAVLTDLRTAVSQDLTVRGGSLARVIQINAAANLPSLVWAQKLYQDSNREKQLVQSANPIHPAFMPIQFKALSA